jgi:hypothetical protein
VSILETCNEEWRHQCLSRLSTDFLAKPTKKSLKPVLNRDRHWWRDRVVRINANHSTLGTLLTQRSTQNQALSFRAALFSSSKLIYCV